MNRRTFDEELLFFGVVVCLRMNGMAALILAEYPDDVKWNQDVYTGRHFDDLVLSTSGPRGVVIQSIALLMFSTSCLETVEELGIHHSNLPPQKIMFFAKYEWSDTLRYIPYDVQGKDNLYRRLLPQECPTVFYFEAGKTVNQPSIWTIQKGDFLSWIWAKVAVTVLIRNLRNDSILVKLAGPGPEVSPRLLDPGETGEVEAYLSYFMVVTVSAECDLGYKFLFGEVLDNHTSVFVVRATGDLGRIDYTETEWVKTKEKEVWAEEEMWLRWQCKLAEMYLMGFKQMMLIPITSSDEYMETVIPKGVHSLLLTYYNEHKEQKVVPEQVKWPVVNDDEVQLYELSLSDYLQDRIRNILITELESFCTCQVDITQEILILEMQQYHIIRPHTENPTNCVWTAYFLLDSYGADSWQFIWYNKTGARKFLFLTPGDLIIIESAALIHGFPVPFTGTRALIMAVNIEKLEGWTWYDDWLGDNRDQHYLVHGPDYDFVEPVFVLKTAIMKQTRDRDEL